MLPYWTYIHLPTSPVWSLSNSIAWSKLINIQTQQCVTQGLAANYMKKRESLDCCWLLLGCQNTMCVTTICHGQYVGLIYIFVLLNIHDIKEDSWFIIIWVVCSHNTRFALITMVNCPVTVFHSWNLGPVCLLETVSIRISLRCRLCVYMAAVHMHADLCMANTFVTCL